MSNCGFDCSIQSDCLTKLNCLPTDQERFLGGTVLSATAAIIGMVEVSVEDPAYKSNALLFDSKYVYDSIPISLHCK